MGDARGSCNVSSAADVLVISGMRRVGGLCEMCMCLARGAVGGEWGERIGFGLYQSFGNKGSVGRVFGFRWCM